jgi:hypothetical protein
MVDFDYWNKNYSYLYSVRLMLNPKNENRMTQMGQSSNYYSMDTGLPRLENLRYLILSTKRLSLARNDQVRYELKTPCHRDSASAQVKSRQPVGGIRDWPCEVEHLE